MVLVSVPIFATKHPSLKILAVVVAAVLLLNLYFLFLDLPS
jgi:hypothetical protein